MFHFWLKHFSCASRWRKPLKPLSNESNNGKWLKHNINSFIFPSKIKHNFLCSSRHALVIYRMIKACDACWRKQQTEITHCRLFTWNNSSFHPLIYNKKSSMNCFNEEKSDFFVVIKIHELMSDMYHVKTARDVRRILMCGVCDDGWGSEREREREREALKQTFSDPLFITLRLALSHIFRSFPFL